MIFDIQKSYLNIKQTLNKDTLKEKKNKKKETKEISANNQQASDDDNMSKVHQTDNNDFFEA